MRVRNGQDARVTEGMLCIYDGDRRICYNQALVPALRSFNSKQPWQGSLIVLHLDQSHEIW